MSAGSRGFIESLSRLPGSRLAVAGGVAIRWIDRQGRAELASAGDLVEVLLEPTEGLAFGSGKRERCYAPAGTVMLSPAGSIHSVIWTGEKRSLLVGLPKGEFAKRSAIRHGSMPFELQSWGLADQTALAIAKALSNEVDGATHSPKLVESLVASLAFHLARTYYVSPELQPAPGQQQFDAGIRALLQRYLSENFNRQITVPDLAALAAMSRSHFMDRFRRTFGKPPHRYILDLRLDHALQLLHASDLPIVEIAVMAGFSSQSHLTSMLRRHRGITPQQIRSRSE